jgi:hypothetical protein
MTHIAAVAFRVSEAERSVAARAGFGPAPEDHERYVILVRLSDMVANWDPHRWGDGTMTAAHLWLLDHYEELIDGADLDVEPLRLALFGLAGR